MWFYSFNFDIPLKKFVRNLYNFFALCCNENCAHQQLCHKSSSWQTHHHVLGPTSNTFPKDKKCPSHASPRDVSSVKHLVHTHLAWSLSSNMCMYMRLKRLVHEQASDHLSVPIMSNVIKLCGQCAAKTVPGTSPWISNKEPAAAEERQNETYASYIHSPACARLDGQKLVFAGKRSLLCVCVW